MASGAALRPTPSDRIRDEAHAGSQSILQPPRPKRKTQRWTQNEREQGCLSPIPCYHAIVVFLDSLLLGILQVERQNKSVSLFSEHPANMRVFLGSACIYSLGAAFKLHLRHNQLNSIYLPFVDSAVLISAVTSPVSIGLIFLHTSATSFFSILSIICLILVAYRHINLIIAVCKWVYEETENRFRAAPPAQPAAPNSAQPTSSSTGLVHLEHEIIQISE